MWRSIKQRFVKKDECQKVKGMLSPYVDQRLSSREQGEVEYHLASCQLCQGEFASLRATVEWLQQAPAVVSQQSFTLAEVRPAPRRRVAFAGLRVATAVVAVALVGIFAADLLHQFETSRPLQPEGGAAGQEEQLAGDEARLFSATDVRLL